MCFLPGKNRGNHSDIPSIEGKAVFVYRCPFLPVLLGIDSEAVEYEDVRIFLEIWENPAQADRYLMYLPRIPHTTGDAGERLFITDQDHFDFMRESLTKMATVAVMLAKEKWKVHQDQKSMLN
jgi:hypothetical protein